MIYTYNHVIIRFPFPTIPRTRSLSPSRPTNTRSGLGILRGGRVHNEGFAFKNMDTDGRHSRLRTVPSFLGGRRRILLPGTCLGYLHVGNGENMSPLILHYHPSHPFFSTRMLSVRLPIVNKFANLQALGEVRLKHLFYALGQACGSATDIETWKGVAMQDVPYTACGTNWRTKGWC